MQNLFVVVGRPLAEAIDLRMSNATSSHNTAMMQWLEFVVVRWGCNTTVAGSTTFAKEVHDTMGRLLTHLRTADGHHITSIVDAFAHLRGRLTVHEKVIYPHDLEVLVPAGILSRWLKDTCQQGTADFGAFIRRSNDIKVNEDGTTLATSAEIDSESTPKAPPLQSRLVANPSVSIADPPNDREGLDLVIAAARKRILHLVKLRRRVEEMEYQAMAGKAADIAKASEPPETLSTMMKDISIGFDMRLMALAGGVVGYYMCHIRGLDGGTCWVGAIVGVVLMTVVDAVLMIIRIGKDDVKTNKAKRKEAVAVNQPRKR